MNNIDNSCQLVLVVLRTIALLPRAAKFSYLSLLICNRTLLPGAIPSAKHSFGKATEKCVLKLQSFLSRLQFPAAFYIAVSGFFYCWHLKSQKRPHTALSVHATYKRPAKHLCVWDSEQRLANLVVHQQHKQSPQKVAGKSHINRYVNVSLRHVTQMKFSTFPKRFPMVFTLFPSRQANLLNDRTKVALGQYAR